MNCCMVYSRWSETPGRVRTKSPSDPPPEAYSQRSIAKQQRFLTFAHASVRFGDERNR